MKIIDMHSHVFPDAIARKASESIGDFYGMPVRYDGTAGGLMQHYQHAGIDMGCIHSVALTPHYIPSINRFIADTVRRYDGKLIGFAAIHPDEENIPALIEEVRRDHLMGFKIHPDMQRFALDSSAAMDMFAAIEGRMPIIIHTGDPRFNYSHPGQMKKVLDAFPKLTCVCAHLGGWSEWEDAWKMLSAYENVYVDTSSSLYAMSPDEGRTLIRRYSRERVLFGVDYPMWNPKEELERLIKLNLTETEMERILHANAEQLLGIS